MNGMSNERRALVTDERTSDKPLAGKPHSLFLDNRRSMTIHGVTDVLSFDENEVYLVTSCGRLSLEGTGLHVTVLNTGDGIVEVTGRLYSLLYDDNDTLNSGDHGKHKAKGGFFGRLFS